MENKIEIEKIILSELMSKITIYLTLSLLVTCLAGHSKDGLYL